MIVFHKEKRIASRFLFKILFRFDLLGYALVHEKNDMKPDGLYQRRQYRLYPAASDCCIRKSSSPVPVVREMLIWYTEAICWGLRTQ